MAASPNKISTFKVPDDGKVIDSDWQDDIDVEYAIYGDNEKQEGQYISPKSVSKESIKKIKKLQVELAFNGIKRFREQELAKAA